MFGMGGGGGAPAGGGGGGGMLGSLKGLTKMSPWGAIGGALGGVFGAIGENKKAKIAAENENKKNAWQHALDTSNYGQTDQWRHRKRNRSAGIREALFKGIVRAPGSGLSKILGGFEGTSGKNIAYNEGNVEQAKNIYEQAGAPPKLKAETGGWASVIGGGLKGAFG